MALYTYSVNLIKIEVPSGKLAADNLFVIRACGIVIVYLFFILGPVIRGKYKYLSVLYSPVIGSGVLTEV